MSRQKFNDSHALVMWCGSHRHVFTIAFWLKPLDFRRPSNSGFAGLQAEVAAQVRKCASAQVGLVHAALSFHPAGAHAQQSQSTVRGSSTLPSTSFLVSKPQTAGRALMSLSPLFFLAVFRSSKSATFQIFRPCSVLHFALRSRVRCGRARAFCFELVSFDGISCFLGAKCA